MPKKKTVLHKKKLPLVTLTIRGAAKHDKNTMQAIILWLSLQKIDYAMDRHDYAETVTARYYAK